MTLSVVVGGQTPRLAAPCIANVQARGLTPSTLFLLTRSAPTRRAEGGWRPWTRCGPPSADPNTSPDCRAEVEAERLAAVAAEGLAQHGEIGLGLRQARSSARQVAPRSRVSYTRTRPSGVTRSASACERDDERAVGIVGIDGEREAEIGGKARDRCRCRSSSRRRRPIDRRRRGTACRASPAGAARARMLWTQKACVSLRASSGM